jgi:hypothetical protein
MKPEKKLQVSTVGLVYSILCPHCGDHNYHTTAVTLPKIIECEHCLGIFTAIKQLCKDCKGFNQKEQLYTFVCM